MLDIAENPLYNYNSYSRISKFDKEENMEQKGNTGWAVLGFFFPLIGFILWLVWKDSKPGDSKMAGKGCLIGIIVSVVLGIVGGIVTACTAASAVNTFANTIKDVANSCIKF